MLSLTPAANYSVGMDTNPEAIVAADFNHDGHLDLATANTGGNTVSVLLGSANGTFQAAKISAAGANPFSLAVGDFNTDGTLDLAAINRGARGVHLMFGNRDGTFQAPDHIDVGYPVAESLAAGDFNGDGKMDFVVTSNYRYSNYSYPQGQADVLLSLGGGSFQAPRTYWAYNRALGSAVVAYMNDDPYLDLVTEMPDYSSVLVLLGDGQGNLGGGAVGAYSTNPSAAGDVNGDGKTDIVSAPRPWDWPGTVGVMFGDGEGGISYYPDYNLIGGITSSAILGDFDRDGSLDIATAISYDIAAAIPGNSVSILRNEGLGTGVSGAVENFAVGSAASDGDFNGDGAVNVADYVVWRDSNSTQNGYNDWRTNFGQSATLATPNAVVAGDFNGDGWLDLATANAQGSVSVLFNDQNWSQVLPTLYVSGDPAFVTEGNTGTTNVTFTVTLSRVSNLDVTVHYKTADVGNAVAGYDYVAASGDLIIPVGQTSETITVAVIGDLIPEEYEYVGVELSAPTNATIREGFAFVTILDDEPRISIDDVTVAEGNTGTQNAMFTVSISVASTEDVTMHYDTAEIGGAVAGSDYVAASGIVTITAGQTSATIAIAVLGDRLIEPTETFAVNLSSPTNATIADSDGIGTILDDEPRISINNVTMLEGRNNKTTLFTFTVTLSAAYDQPVTMSYRTVDGTATTSDDDYVAKSGTLIFAPGETTKTITIEVNGDNKNELDEYFNLELFDNSGNSVFTKFLGYGTIWDDD